MTVMLMSFVEHYNSEKTDFRNSIGDYKYSAELISDFRKKFAEKLLSFEDRGDNPQITCFGCMSDFQDKDVAMAKLERLILRSLIDEQYKDVLKDLLKDDRLVEIINEMRNSESFTEISNDELVILESVSDTEIKDRLVQCAIRLLPINDRHSLLRGVHIKEFENIHFGLCQHQTLLSLKMRHNLNDIDRQSLIVYSARVSDNDIEQFTDSEPAKANLTESYLELLSIIYDRLVNIPVVLNLIFTSEYLQKPGSREMLEECLEGIGAFGEDVLVVLPLLNLRHEVDSYVVIDYNSEMLFEYGDVRGSENKSSLVEMLYELCSATEYTTNSQKFKNHSNLMCFVELSCFNFLGNFDHQSVVFIETLKCLLGKKVIHCILIYVFSSCDCVQFCTDIPHCTKRYMGPE